MSDIMTDFPPIGAVPDRVTWRASVILAFDRHDRVLMQLRDDFPHVAGPGKWSLFGGAVEEGEDLITAAIREFVEETGILLDPAMLAPLASLPATSKQGGALFVFRASRVIAPEDIRLGEGAGFAFMTRAQIAQYPVQSQIAALLSQH